MNQKKAKRQRKSPDMSQGTQSTKFSLVDVFNQAGVRPTPAMNFSRPMAFDSNLPLSVETKNPFQYGSLQYVSTLLSIPEMSGSQALSLAAQRGFEAIRNMLRSNLMYDANFLQSYILRIMYLVPLIATVTRDLGYRTFASPQLPHFSEFNKSLVGLSNVEQAYQSSIVGSNPSLVVSNLQNKTYMNDDEIAHTMDWYNVKLRQQLNMLPIPATMLAYYTYIFGNLFINQRDDGTNQIYRFDPVHIPMYKTTIKDGVYSTELAGYLETVDIDVDQISEDITDIISKFGTLIADLSKVSTMGIIPIRDVGNSYPSFVSDATLLTAIKNAYTDLPSVDFPSLNTNFIQVDVPKDFSIANLPLAIQFTGALTKFAGSVDGSNIAGVAPIHCVGQVGIVYSETPVRMSTLPWFVPAASSSDPQLRFENDMSGLIGIGFTSKVVSGFTSSGASGVELSKWPIATNATQLYINGAKTTFYEPSWSPNPRDTDGISTAAVVDLRYQTSTEASIRLLTWVEDNGWQSKPGVDVGDDIVATAATKFIILPVWTYNSLITPSVMSWEQLLTYGFRWGSDPSKFESLGITSFRTLYEYLSTKWTTSDENVRDVMGYGVMSSGYMRMNQTFWYENGIDAFNGPVLIHNTWNPEDAISVIGNLDGTLSISENELAASGMYMDSNADLLTWIMREVDFNIPIFKYDKVQTINSSGSSSSVSTCGLTLVKDTELCTLYSVEDLASIMYIMYTSLYFPILKMRTN